MESFVKTSLTSYQTLLCEVLDPKVLVVCLNRPHAANALNTQMGEDVRELFRSLANTGDDIRCVVLTGAGRGAFCAGGDLKERLGMSDALWRQQHIIFEQAFCALMDCTIPTIAAVNGPAYGGGCEFALACDFIYASDTARFALPETGLGIIPGGGGTQNLPRAVGSRRARELIFAGASFTAEQALAWGMVNYVFPRDMLMDEALATASRIARNAPIAVRQAKQAISVGAEAELKTGLALEIQAYDRAATSADRAEGVAAYFEKREPNFQGS